MTTIEQRVEQNIGPYLILRSLGRGTLSAVYEARLATATQPVILTTFLVPEALSLQARQRFLTRFAHESAVLKHLRHPYILPIQDVGEHMGNPYLVNPSVKGSSLTKLLKQKGRFTPEQTLELLKRMADSIDYAHSNGVIHGTLSTTNILLSDTMQIAGFGLLNMLTMRGLEAENQQVQPAFRSIVGTTLGSAGYIAPEVMQGKAFDGRSDVYTLGILLLELLSGSSPFSSTNISVMHTLQTPRLSALCPELPARLDAVIQKALDPNPVQRIQSAGMLATLFAQALTPDQITAPQPVLIAKTFPDSQITLPNAIDWLVKEENTPTGKWQLIPPVTSHTMAVHPANSQKTSGLELSVPNIPQLEDDAQFIDPFVWWSSMTAAQVATQTPGTFTKPTTSLPTSKKRVAAKKQERRRVVAMLAGGGVVALSALGFGGITLAHVLQQKQTTTTTAQVQQSIATTAPTVKPTTQSTVKGTQTKPTPTTRPKPTMQPTQAVQPTATSATVGQPTQQPTTQPTQPPPTPTPQPQHTGTVIGSTSQGVNSAQGFTNPTNGANSVLIHLPNGNFVAYSKACTHQGVQVYYDSGSQKLKCPAHGAVFDPANGGNPVQGPANSPLQNISIRVNGDGTITTG